MGRSDGSAFILCVLFYLARDAFAGSGLTTSAGSPIRRNMAKGTKMDRAVAKGDGNCSILSRIEDAYENGECYNFKMGKREYAVHTDRMRQVRVLSGECNNLKPSWYRVMPTPASNARFEE